MIQIHNWHDAALGEKHIAEFSVLIKKMVHSPSGPKDWWLHKVKVYPGKNGGYFLSPKGFPTGHLDKYGKKEYSPVSHPAAEWRSEFDKMVMDAIEPLLSMRKNSSGNF